MNCILLTEGFCIGRIILKWILERLDGKGAWTGLIWLRIGTGDGLL
jgi:hypothetical protein